MNWIDVRDNTPKVNETVLVAYSDGVVCGEV